MTLFIFKILILLCLFNVTVYAKEVTVQQVNNPNKTSQELKVAIAIENKIGSQEHNAGNSKDSQLKKYHEKLTKNFPDYQLVEVFLTPDGTEPTENWIILTYTDVIEILTPIINDNKGGINMLKKYFLGAINICLLVILFIVLFYGISKISLFSYKLNLDLKLFFTF